MNIFKTELNGIYCIEPNVYEDNRGWFMETWSEKKIRDHGINATFVQDNQSFTLNKGTIRGLHFQINQMSQAKLVRCIKGSIMDVAADIRKGSPNYKKWVAIELSEKNKRQLFIPKGFAHGFVTLTDNVEIVYKCDNFYSKEDERSIRFDDPELKLFQKLLLPLNPILFQVLSELFQQKIVGQLE